MYRARHVRRNPMLRERRSKQLLGAGLLAAAFIVAAPATAQAQVAPATALRPVDVNVHSGDTLSAIVTRACGWSSPSLWRGAQLDNPAVVNANLIYPGQPLHITCRQAAAPSAPATKATQPAVAPVVTSAAWVSPLANPHSGSCYGPRQGGFHYGFDLPAPTGTPIRAATAGAVAVVKYQAGGGGNYIVLSHGAGIFTAYMHLRERTPLSVGAHVVAGQTIGYVGATGDATGPHLHFEVHRGLWSKVAPAPFMAAHGVRVGC